MLDSEDARPLLIFTIVLLFLSVTAGELVTEEVVQAADSSGIAWYDYEEGLKQANRTDKPIFIHFGASRCGPCEKMKEDVYTNRMVIEKAEEFVCIMVDVDQKKKIADEHSVKVLPTLAYMNSSGEEIFRRTGYQDVQQVLNDMENAELGIDPTHDSIFPMTICWIPVILGVIGGGALIIALFKRYWYGEDKTKVGPDEGKRDI